MGLPSTPMGTPTCETERTPYTPLVRLKHIVSLFRTIGPTLKRLVLDMQPIYSPHSEAQDNVSRGSTHVFVSMPKLEELVASYDALDHFHIAPPNLKRLAITIDNMHKAAVRFIFAASALEMLIALRPKELSAAKLTRSLQYTKAEVWTLSSWTSMRTTAPHQILETGLMKMPSASGRPTCRRASTGTMMSWSFAMIGSGGVRLRVRFGVWKGREGWRVGWRCNGNLLGRCIRSLIEETWRVACILPGSRTRSF